MEKKIVAISLIAAAAAGILFLLNRKRNSNNIVSSSSATRRVGNESKHLTTAFAKAKKLSAHI